MYKKPSWHGVSVGKRGRLPETTILQSGDGWSKETRAEAGRRWRVERKGQSYSGGGGGYIPFERGFARVSVPETYHLSEARDIRFIALRSVE